MMGWPGMWALRPVTLGASPSNSRKEMQLSASVDSLKPTYSFLSNTLHHSFSRHVLTEHLLYTKHGLRAGDAAKSKRPNLPFFWPCILIWGLPLWLSW